MGLSTHDCMHAEWIAQPRHHHYLYHCRHCSLVASDDRNTNTWQIVHGPDHSELADESERGRALRALDRWMSERETTFGHPIFAHPNVIQIDPC